MTTQSLAVSAPRLIAARNAVFAVFALNGLAFMDPDFPQQIVVVGIVRQLEGR